MAAGDDLLLGRPGREFQDSDSVLREGGQELRKVDLPVAKRQMVILRPAAIVDVAAEDALGAQLQRLEMRMPAEEFLARGVAEIMPVADHFRWECLEHDGKFLFVRKFLKNFADLEAEADFQLAGQRDQRIERFLDARVKSFSSL